MAADEVVAKGYDWSADALYDGWGEDDEIATKLGDEVILRFHGRIPAAHWTPSTAEVKASVKLDADELNTTRQEVTQEVWAEFVNETLVL